MADLSALQPTPATLRLRQLIEDHRQDLAMLLVKYGASNPRIFGSVARGDATDDSDIDILVDMPLKANGRSILLNAIGLDREVNELLPVKVDVFAPRLLKFYVSDEVLDVMPL